MPGLGPDPCPDPDPDPGPGPGPGLTPCPCPPQSHDEAGTDGLREPLRTLGQALDHQDPTQVPAGPAPGAKVSVWRGLNTGITSHVLLCIPVGKTGWLVTPKMCPESGFFVGEETTQQVVRETILNKCLINWNSSHRTFHHHHQASFPHRLTLQFEFSLLQFIQQALREVTCLPQDTRKQML